MTVASLPPLRRLKFAIGPVSAALLVFFPTAGKAERHRHLMSPKARKIIAAAKARSLQYSPPEETYSGGGGSVTFTSGNYAGYGAMTVIAGQYTGMTKVSAVLAQLDMVDLNAADLIKSGVGTLDLTSAASLTLTLGGTLNLGAGAASTVASNPGALVVNGSTLTLFSGVGTTIANPLTLTTGQLIKTGTGTLTLSGALPTYVGNLVFTGTLSIAAAAALQSLPTSFIALINEGRYTLADGTAITVVVDPITGEKSVVSNGVTLPPPDAANPLRLIPKPSTVTTASTDSAASAGTLTGTTLLTSSSTVAGGTLQINSAGTLTTNSATASQTIAAVPEPSAFLLALVGGAFLAQRRRRG